jgi:hypothetical protein
MNCDQARERFALLLYGELSFDEEERLEQHVAFCSGCQAGLKAERALHEAMDDSRKEVAAHVLAACRAELFGSVKAVRERRPAGWQAWFHLEWGMFWKPAAAMALVAAGFFGARLTGSGSSREVSHRVRYVEPGRDGAVTLRLEEVRQKTVSGRVEEEPIRRLLLAAMQDPADAALRVESVDLLKGIAEAPEVRATLRKAMVADPNAGVRMKALEALRPFSGEETVRRSLGQVLLREENQGIRAQALDLLVEKRAVDMVDVLQELMRREDNDYIRLRTRKALHEMNATVEAF